MDLSVIIVSWNVRDYLKKCLQSIYSGLDGLEAEVFVIDNNSSDGTREMVEENFPQAKLIANQKNLGFAKASNQGLRLAGGRYLLLLNPDTEVKPDSLVKIVDFMEKNKTVGIAGCKLLNPDGSLQPSVRRLPNFLVHLGMMFKLHHFVSFEAYFAKDFDYERVSEVEQVMGAFMIIRRQTLEQLGLLDEKYRLWFEEVDYCQKALDQGVKVVYLPQVQVIHYGNQSFSQAPSVKKQFYFSLSRLHYIYQHSDFVSYLIILLLTPLSLFLTLLGSLFKNDGK